MGATDATNATDIIDAPDAANANDPADKAFDKIQTKMIIQYFPVCLLYIAIKGKNYEINSGVTL